GLDHRTDIYSLGATLYEMLTLEPAVPGPNGQELLRRVTASELRSPRQLNRAVPTELETIVLKAMAREPADRYATAQGLADDLRRWLEGRPILARRPPLIRRWKHWVRRHRPLAAASAALIATCLVLAGFDVWRNGQR